MNNPFYYTPSEECRAAVHELIEWLSGERSTFCDHLVDTAFRAEIDKGKMFGVLIVEGEETALTRNISVHGKQFHYLAGYSGQICSRSDWPEFVPAVFDYLQPNGYFKQHEAEITELNNEIKQETDLLSTSPSASLSADKSLTPNTHHPTPVSTQQLPPSDKRKREGETDEDYIRRRQFENAELHRWKLRQRKIDEEKKAAENHITSLKTLRRQKSDALQRWLFHHFLMLNGRGESQDLIAIRDGEIPPAGSGECCEPKLLQYAFQHGLHPVSMAMFWWGESPRSEIRHHLQFYPACNGKCKPILRWMLQGIDVDANPLESKEEDERLAAQLKIIYEDDDICVICKPAGMLSVPGKSERVSVQSLMQQRYPDNESPLIVHRLDMATSGLMVIAKTLEAYHNLQQQFAKHEISKRYVAVLSKPLPKDVPQEGTISLPLRPDLDDRPRQVVDDDYGREAVSIYKKVANDRLWLWPKTGRTHQLRVHCAHQLGLNDPIKGDSLYGTPSTRLYLHAEQLTFQHPTNGRQMSFTAKAPF